MRQTMKLKDIVSGQQNFKVFGRLIRLWDAKYVTTNSLISIDGVLLDEDGTMAQFSVARNLEKDFRPMLTQDHVYMFSGLKAAHLKNKSYNYHHQPYILQFTSTTKVNHLESRGANIPHYAFKFCPFDEVPTKSITSKPLLGVISDVGPFDFAGPTSKKKNRKIQIRNLDEQTQQIILWDKEGETFDEKTILEKSQQGVVVGIFAGVTGKFLGNYETSSSSATRIYIDLDLPEVETYRTSYKWETPALKQKLPKVVQMSSLQAAGKLHNIEEISALPMESFQASQNRQIEPDNQPPALDMAIGKTRLFNLGMSKDFSSRYSIKYVLKKSYKIEDHEESIMLSTTEETNDTTLTSETPNHTDCPTLNNLEGSDNNTTPAPTHVIKTRSGAKRSLDFSQDDANKSNRSRDENNGNKQDINLGLNSTDQLPISSTENYSNPMKKHNQGHAANNTVIQNNKQTELSQHASDISSHTQDNFQYDSDNE